MHWTEAGPGEVSFSIDTEADRVSRAASQAYRDGRARHGWSQKKAAAKKGCSEAWLHRLECEPRLMNEQFAQEYAALLGIPVPTILREP